MILDLLQPESRNQDQPYTHHAVTENSSDYVQ